MNELVVHHTYEHGMAFDVSEHGNHGEPTSVGTVGTGDFAGSFGFGGREGRVHVAPSASLRDMRSIRVHVRFRPGTIGSGEMTRPFYLVHADASFGIYIAAMAGTINCWVAGDPDDDNSVYGNTMVTEQEWNEVDMIHDGISEMRLILNGVEVGAIRRPLGPVPDIGPGGLMIGHHIDPLEFEGNFQGRISEFSLHAYEPRNDLERLLDLCCFDRETMDELVERVRAAGWDAERLGNKVRDVLDLGSEIAADARADDAGRIQEHRRLAREIAFALHSPDRRALYEVVDRHDASLRQEITDAELVAYGDRVAGQVGDWPFSLTDLVELAPALCWERFVPAGLRPPEDEDGGGGEDDGGGDGGEADEPEWPQGDPDTDRTGDEPPDGWIQGGEEPPGVTDDDGSFIKPNGDDKPGSDGDETPDETPEDGDGREKRERRRRKRKRLEEGLG